MRIINVGLYPPPYGGVSIHLQRLLEFLEKEKKECLVIDITKKRKERKNVKNLPWSWCILVLFFTKRSVLHFHNFSPKNSFFYFVLSFRHFVILSFHNERFLSELNSSSRLARAIADYSLNKLHYIVVDNEICMRYAEEIILDRKKLVMIPEYIGPLHIPALESGTITTARGKFTYLLSSNAFQISFHRSQDLYGLDLLVQVLARLVHQDHLNAGLVFLLPNIGDKAYFQFIKTEIDRLSITDRFLFLTEPIEEASSLWKVSDIVIRATNTDGNSLSVLEALTLGVPVIASDCTERPAGCILFRNRDEDDLYRRVKATLIDLPSHRKRLASMRWSDNAASFLRLYSRMETLAHESYK